MKILFTVQNYYPEVSGVPIVVGYLAEGLAKLGHDVNVVTKLSAGTPLNENINGVKVFRFKLGFDKLRGHIGEKEEYINFVENFKCDVIVNECSQCETTDLLLNHLDGISAKKIFHSHGFSGNILKPFVVTNGFRHFIGNIYNFIRFKLYYWKFDDYINKFDHFVYLSEVDSGKMYLDKRNVSNYSIIENAAEDIFLDELNKDAIGLKKYFDKEEMNYFISIANFTQVKNQQMLLKSFYKANVDPTYSLVMIGSKKTDYYYYLKKLKGKLDKIYGYKEVFFLTGIPRQEIPRLLEHAKLYLVSSKFEEYSVSIVEAMMKGIPFISTDVGNARILPGGCVVRTESEMANKVEELLSDSSLYNNYSKNGREYALKHCVRDVIINKFEEMLNNICNEDSVGVLNDK